MKNYIISIFILFTFIPTLIIGIKINENNSKIKSYNQPVKLVDRFITLNKNKDWNDLWFFTCRPAESYQEQVDWDRFTQDFVNKSKTWNWLNVTYDESNGNKFFIKNIGQKNKIELISFELNLKKQKALISELKTEESYCFEIRNIIGL